MGSTESYIYGDGGNRNGNYLHEKNIDTCDSSRSRGCSDTSINEDGSEKKYKGSSNSVVKQMGIRNTSRSVKLKQLLEEEDDEDSSRPHPAMNINNLSIKRIKEKKLKEKDEDVQKEDSFFSKILVAFGCISRDKPKK